MFDFGMLAALGRFENTRGFLADAAPGSCVWRPNRPAQVLDANGVAGIYSRAPSARCRSAGESITAHPKTIDHAKRPNR